MTDNPLQRLKALGQSVWLDDIRRPWLHDGTLAGLIAEDGVSGVTSNPAIFERAIAQHEDYDAAIVAMVTQAARQGSQLRAAELYESLAVEDIRQAADLLRRVYEGSRTLDGYVSLEVSPHLAYETEATVVEARRLWERVDRPNLMIKVPATSAGLPAIRRLIAEGININATLLFSVARYRDVTDAHMSGLEDRLRAGQSLAGVSSVASFFLSRIDTAVDAELDNMNPPLGSCRGTTATAYARLAYHDFLLQTASPRWRALAAARAQPQRLLWASTSTKDSTYSEVKYIEALVAPDSVVTLPLKTLTAYRKHGRPMVSIEKQLDVAHALPEQLARAGVNLEEVDRQLESEGVRKFVEYYDALMDALTKRAHAVADAASNRIPETGHSPPREER